MAEGLCQNSTVNDRVPGVHSSIVNRVVSRDRSVSIGRSFTVVGLSDEATRFKLPSLQKKCPQSSSVDLVTGRSAIRRASTKYQFDLATKEVMNLGDSYSVIKEEESETGGLEQRIQNRRKARHEEVVSNKKNALEEIDQKMQGELVKICETLKCTLLKLEDGLSELFSKSSSNKNLVAASYKDMEELKEKIRMTFKEKRCAIKEFEDAATALEAERASQVSMILSTCSPKLHSIAFMPLNDIKKTIEDEAVDVNMAILANKKHYAMLSESMIKADYQLLKNSMDKWNALLESWSEVQCQLEKDKFSEFMKSSVITDPMSIQELIDELHKKQLSVNKERMELLSEISVAKPSKHNKAVVTEWNERYHRSVEKLEEIHSHFISDWQSCQDNTVGECERKMDQIKEHLISSQILDSGKAFKFLTDNCLPLLEYHQSQITQQLDHLQRSLDSLVRSHHVVFSTLFQYTQGAAHLLDTYLANEDTNTRDRESHLSTIRKEHDIENQTMEANLDIVLDRLRQTGTNEELDEFFRIAQEMLRVIKEKYISFHDEMTGICLSYPSEVKEELDNYDKNLCEYFGVDRNPPVKKKQKGKQRYQNSKGSPAATAKLPDTPKSKPQSSVRQSRKVTPVVPSSPSSVSLSTTPLSNDVKTILSEVMSTSNGTLFYVLCSQTDATTESESNIFMTQDEDVADGIPFSLLNSSLVIEDQTFVETRRNFCINFLDHLETMKMKALHEIEAGISGKIEELRTELELRLHLHKPRPLRVRQDIHDVRKAELIVHQERVSQHVKAVSSSLHQQKEILQSLPEELNKMYQDMSNYLTDLRKKLPEAKYCSSLRNMYIEAKEKQKMYTSNIEKMLTKERCKISDAFNHLLSSNEEYMTSVKLFSQGGNYCHSERDTISTRLGKQVEKIQKCEKTVLSGLETMEKTVIKRSNEVFASSFENDFQFHLADLTLVEAVNSRMIHCQTLIKAEVLASNVQSKKLFKLLNDLESTPSAGFKISEFVQKLPSIFEPFHERIKYLHCKSKGHLGSQVGTKRKESTISLPVPTTGPISAINLSKTILNTTTNIVASSNSTVDEGGSVHSSKSIALDGVKQEKKSIFRRKQPQQLIDRRNVTYGIGGGKDGSRCFLPNVRKILTSTHNEVYDLIEEYYTSQKCTRGVVASNRWREEIPESFDQMMDMQIERLHDYRVQAEEYRNDCIDEFHRQFSILYEVLSKLIAFLYDGLLRHTNLLMSNKIDQIKKDYNLKQEELSEQKNTHDKQLRTCLGHPSKETELKELCSVEKERFHMSMEAIQQKEEEIKDVIHSESRMLICSIVQHTFDMLKLLNVHSFAPEDITPPSQQPLPLNKLLESIAYHRPDAAKKKDAKPFVPDANDMWPGIEDMSLAFNDKDTKKKMQMTLKKSRTTPVHFMVIQARDNTVKEFQEMCAKRLERLEQSSQEEQIKQEKLYKAWSDSVSSIKKLY